ncbi:MAG: hypothetical protein CMH30_07335 [Micavibrio sp.]|nr:hypothetical protein [Micavibrio sp.]|tara:strand:+ start:88 stop:474 length:387 start_codon:yes stop_codon:yes gene_type:complete
MRHTNNNNARRSRGGKNRNQSSNRSQGNNKSQVFDSNGPDVRIRGTAQQVADKYMALAKDALTSDNSVLAENYYQHAEHYQRLLNSFVESEERYKQSREEDLALPETILKPANSASEDAAETQELQSA